MPKPLTIPASCGILPPGGQLILPGQVVAVARYDLAGFFGSNCTFSFESAAPFNVGIYGPIPAGQPVLDGRANGRMRSPKAGDQAVHQCQGNFRPGTYYLVFRSGEEGPIQADVIVRVKEGLWKPFG